MLSFSFPDVLHEQGEIERVAGEFAGENPHIFLAKFLECSKNKQLTTLDEHMWSKLENTDSYNIQVGGWDVVAQHAVEGHAENPRDWKSLKQRIESAEMLDAPIVCQKGDRLHLVSGNTRLMVARALGKSPQVLLVKID